MCMCVFIYTCVCAHTHIYERELEKGVFGGTEGVVFIRERGREHKRANMVKVHDAHEQKMSLLSLSLCVINAP